MKFQNFISVDLQKDFTDTNGKAYLPRPSVYHGIEDKYQQMIIFTGDADLCYPLEIVKEFGKITFAVFLPNRFSLGISHRANSSFILNYLEHFKPIRKDLPTTLKILKVKNPVRKRTR